MNAALDIYARKAHPLDGDTRLGNKAVRKCRDDDTCAESVAQFLGESGAARVTNWRLAGKTHAVPPTDGHSASGLELFQ
jgi:hypothetical protein